MPPGSDSTTNFVRVVGGCEVLVQGVRFLALTNQLDECMQVLLEGFVTDVGVNS